MRISIWIYRVVKIELLTPIAASVNKQVKAANIDDDVLNNIIPIYYKYTYAEM